MNAITHSWTTIVCKNCKIGFQVESINAIGFPTGSMKGKIKCPFCQSSDLKTEEKE